MNKKIALVVLLVFTIIFAGNGCTTDSQINITNVESKYIHISFDDISKSINNLASNDYSSVWDEPFFGFLKELHEKYNAKFSLYLFFDCNIDKCGGRYQNQLNVTSSWLKFGLHAESTDSSFKNGSYAQGLNDWNKFVKNVIAFTGSSDSVDRVPRLQGFSGSKDCLLGMRDAQEGALGFLTADDSRDSYYLTDEQIKSVKTSDYYKDVQTDLCFVATDMRGDWFDGDFTSDYDYDKPTESDVYSELACRFSNSEYDSQTGAYIWFCHEWSIYDGKKLNKNKKRLEDVCRFAQDYNISFDYPQFRIADDTAA